MHGTQPHAEISAAPRPRKPKRARRAARRGFTLIEAAMTTVIIGVGVVAMVEAQQSFLRSNNWSNQASTATLLAREIREFTRFLPRHDPVTGLYFETDDDGNVTGLAGWGPEEGEVVASDFDDIDDFDGMTFTYLGDDGIVDGDLPGPINAFGYAIEEIDFDGAIVYELDPDTGTAAVDEDGVPIIVNMQGWSQTVVVEKVMPYDVWPDTPVLNDFSDADNEVDEFPLRVTVIIDYQGPADAQPSEITRMTWIVP
ncbi:MAG: hypothetical protein AAGG07_00865 [Planctomycetota bacterium]